MSNISKIVAVTLGIDEPTVNRILGTYVETSLIQAAFHGPVATVLGELTLTEDGLQITRQNPKVLALVGTDLSKEELLNSIAAVVAEQGH